MRLSLAVTATLAVAVSATQPGRTLSAATRPSSLKRRSQPLDFANDVELFYAHANNLEGEDNYGARVNIVSSNPILVLEDTEDWLSDIECAGDNILLTKKHFVDSGQLAKCRDLIDGHIITSHSTCNDQHERLVYKVLAVEEITEASASLRIARTNWKTAFDSISVEMGYTTIGHDLRDHARFSRRKRQDDSSATFDLSSILPTLTASATASAIDSSAPSATQINVAATVTNQAIPLPSNYPITLMCNECSTRGTLDLAWGQFDIDLFDSNDDGQHVTGYANLTANGLGATLNIGANVRQNYSFLEPVLGTIQTASYRIPGLGGVALALGPFIAGGYTLNGEITLNQYGFSVQIPDGSTASLNLNGPDAVDIDTSGFENTQVTAIPWNSTTELNGISAWLAFRWTIQASFRFLSDQTSGIADGFDGDTASGAIYLDTPILNMSVSRVQNVDTNCQPTSDTSLINTLANVIRVTLAAGWDFGAYLDIDVADHDFDPSYFHRGDNELDLANGASNLCLNFQSGHYLTANESVVQATHQGAAYRTGVPLYFALGLGLITVLMSCFGSI